MKPKTPQKKQCNGTCEVCDCKKGKSTNKKKKQ